MRLTQPNEPSVNRGIFGNLLGSNRKLVQILVHGSMVLSQEIPKMWDWLQNLPVDRGWKTVSRNTDVENAAGMVLEGSEKGFNGIWRKENSCYSHGGKLDRKLSRIVSLSYVGSRTCKQ